MMEEIWRNIDGYEGLYQVSNWGRVKSFDRWVIGKSNSKRLIKGKILKPHTINGGYLQATLSKNGKKRIYLVHRLVAKAFIPNPYNLSQINHKDENPSNNNISNLEWCSTAYNCNYGSRIERITNKKNKTVYQYSLEGKLIAEYSSTHEVERQTGYSQSNIGKCCNGKYKTAYDFIWTY